MIKVKKQKDRKKKKLCKEDIILSGLRRRWVANKKKVFNLISIRMLQFNCMQSFYLRIFVYINWFKSINKQNYWNKKQPLIKYLKQKEKAKKNHETFRGIFHSVSCVYIYVCRFDQVYVFHSIFSKKIAYLLFTPWNFNYRISM